MDAIVTIITDYLVPAAAIGTAVLTLLVGVKVFKWVRAAL